jgi:hypothetical protein
LPGPAKSDAACFKVTVGRGVDVDVGVGAKVVVTVTAGRGVDVDVAIGVKVAVDVDV